MLTNNKKSFVRSISMLLAMLMVLAVCLTGCGNKAADEALTKAEEAQNAANAAQGTADEAKTLADGVKAALADYLKTADALTEAKVNELIDAALADGVATAADVEALAAKVTAHLGTAHLTKDEVTALIKTEVAANAVKDAMTEAEVREILKEYYKKDDVDALLKNYFGEFDAATVQKLLKDVEKAMTEEEWDEASAIVIETIDSMQDLMTEIFTKTYTQANMKKVNELLKPLGIVAFPPSGDKLVQIAGDEAQAKFQKNLEYTILRVASVEKMEELKDAVDAALAVPTFEKQLAALEQQLYDLGEYVQYGSYSGNTFTATKWPANAGGTYHNKTYAKNTAKETQVVTLNDKADFYTWIDAYDALYTEYIADGALSVAQTEGKSVKNVFTKAGSNNTLQVAVDDAATKSGWTFAGKTVVWDDTAYLNNKYGTTKIADSTIYYLPITVLNNVVAQMDETLYTSHSVETQWKSTGKYGYAGNEKVYSDVNLVAEPEMVRAYSAIVKQLQECQTAANEANTIFDAFQLVIYNDSNLKNVQADYSKVTEAQLLEYLAASMCESNGVTVHNVYLDPQVNTEMAQSYALNGKTDAGIKEYPLYLQMKDKAFDLLWVKYKTQANEWADQILKDYISIVYEAKDNNVATTGATGAITANYANSADPAAALAALATAMTAGGEQTVAAQLSAGFVDAFLTGADLTAEIYTKLGIAANYKTDNLAKFYANNGLAQYVVPASVGATSMTYKGYMANPLNSIKTNAEDIRQRLTGAMLSVDIAIAGASMEEMKASGVAVQKAFYEILKKGVANLEEIYDRFLLEDYKLMTYNEMVLKSGKIVNFYGAKTGLLAAMEQYLVGVSGTTYGGDVAKDKDGIITSWTPGANAAEATLINEQLVANLKSVTINKYATSDGVETVKVGGEAMKQIDAYAAAATATIENVAVKVNFLSYLETARMEWSHIFQAYYKLIKDANVNDFNTMIDLSLIGSDVDNTITVIEYYANHGGIELKDYKQNYIEVLTMISNNDTHTALLSGKTIEQILADATIAGTAFGEAQKAIKSQTFTLPSGATWVVELRAPAEARNYVGTAVVELDEIANANASYTKNNTTTKVYN